MATVQARVQEVLGPAGYNVHSFSLRDARYGNGPLVLFEASLPNFPGDNFDYEVDLPGWPYENGRIDDDNLELLISKILTTLRDSNTDEKLAYADPAELISHMPEAN